jgi:hypothetical protein
LTSVRRLPLAADYPRWFNAQCLPAHVAGSTRARSLHQRRPEGLGYGAGDVQWKTSEGWTGAQTLTIWSDLESVFRFAYSQGHPHGEALRRRKEWFLSHTHPVYVAWWVGDRHRPTWREGVDRIEHLDAHGTSPAAFSFRAPFDASGAPRARPRL